MSACAPTADISLQRGRRHNRPTTEVGTNYLFCLSPTHAEGPLPSNRKRAGHPGFPKLSPDALTSFPLLAKRMKEFEARTFGCREQLIHGFTNASSVGFFALDRSEAGPGGFLGAADSL